MLCHMEVISIQKEKSGLLLVIYGFEPGARPTKHISIEFEIRWKFKTL